MSWKSSADLSCYLSKAKAQKQHFSTQCVNLVVWLCNIVRFSEQKRDVKGNICPVIQVTLSRVGETFIYLSISVSGTRGAVRTSGACNSVKTRAPIIFLAIHILWRSGRLQEFSSVCCVTNLHIGVEHSSVGCRPHGA